jgi:hypothetical protein
MLYLRHEAGHAFNYAYQLHEAEQFAISLVRFGDALPETVTRT